MSGKPVLVITLTSAEDEKTLQRLAEFLHMRSQRGFVYNRIISRAFSLYVVRLIFKMQSKGQITSND